MMEIEKKLPKLEIKNPLIKKLLWYKIDAILIYLIDFILGEIMISGGLYEKGITFGIVNSFFVLALALFWQYRRSLGTLKDQIIKGAIMAVVYAVLDFLLVDLLLEKFNNSMYTYWGTYVAYGIILAIPVLYLLVPQWIKKWRDNKVNKINLTLDKP